MQPIEQVWNWNQFGGGEGDGFYYGPQGGYRAGKNLETKHLENGVIGCNKAVDTTLTYTGTVMSVNRFLKNCIATSNGNVYKNSSSPSIIVNTGTTAYNQIRGWGKLNRSSDTTNYYYGITSINNGVGQVHRFETSLGGVTYNVGSGFTLGEGRLTNGTNTTVLSLPTRLVFSVANTIFAFSRLEVISTLLTLPQDAEIVSITYYQDKYKVFYNIPHGDQTDGYIGYWDGTSGQFDAGGVVEYKSSKILTVQNDGAYDYVVFGDSFTSDLYYFGGINRGVPVRSNIEGSTAYNSRVFLTESAIREGILYITGNNKLTESCLYSFGNYYPGTNKQLVPENSIVINKMGVDVDGLYLYRDSDGKIFKKSFLFAQTAENYEIYSYAMIGNGGLWSIKSIKRVDVSYQLNSESDSIKIYAKINGGPYSNNTTGWVLIKDITGSDYASKRGVTFTATELSALGIGQFYQLEYKVIGTVGGTKSPPLYQIKTTYNDYLKD